MSLPSKDQVTKEIENYSQIGVDFNLNIVEVTEMNAMLTDLAAFYARLIQVDPNSKAVVLPRLLAMDRFRSKLAKALQAQFPNLHEYAVSGLLEPDAASLNEASELLNKLVATHGKPPTTP